MATVERYEGELDWRRSFNFCCPGSEVPRWFSYKSMNLRSKFEWHGMIVSMVCSWDLFYALLLHLRHGMEVDCLSGVDGHLLMGMKVTHYLVSLVVPCSWITDGMRYPMRTTK